MQALAAGGLTQMAVLRTATIDGASIVGHADEIGSLVPGKFADLVILARDPSADIADTETIASVVKNGRVYDPTLASDWPDARPAPKPWFAQERPIVTPKRTPPAR